MHLKLRLVSLPIRTLPSSLPQYIRRPKGYLLNPPFDQRVYLASCFPQRPMPRRHFSHRQKFHISMHARSIGRLDGIVEGGRDHKGRYVKRGSRDGEKGLVVKVIGVGGAVPRAWNGEERASADSMLTDVTVKWHCLKWDETHRQVQGHYRYTRRRSNPVLSMSGEAVDPFCRDARA